MPLPLSDYITALSGPLNALAFDDTLAVIDAHYDFTPTAFQNGGVDNPAGTNSGSCKVFSFAKLHGLSDAQTLAMFAQHYQNVLDEPDGDAHANIRAFMQTGLSGVVFTADALTRKPAA